MPRPDDFQHFIAPKNWTLRGEVRAHEREVNSLLEEGAVEFKVGGTANRQQLVSVDLKTGEQNLLLDADAAIESIIKKRAALTLWDDVKPRIVVDKANRGGKELEEIQEGADTTKPTKSLAEEYAGMHVNLSGDCVQVEEQEAKVSMLWQRLKFTLDQYCMV